MFWSFKKRSPLQIGRLFKTVLLAVIVVGCSGSDSSVSTQNAADDKNRKAAYEVSYKARDALIKERCKVDNNVLFSLREYTIKLPCAYVGNVEYFSYDSDKTDYNDPLLAKGVRPIPVSSFQFSVESADKHEVFSDAKPPLGVVLNISYDENDTDKIIDKCFNELRPSTYERLWCQHNIPIKGVKLIAGLRFNATQYSFSKIPITPDSFPYAYYPEDEWPQLYIETEAFVKSLLQETDYN